MTKIQATKSINPRLLELRKISETSATNVKKYTLNENLRDAHGEKTGEIWMQQKWTRFIHQKRNHTSKFSFLQGFANFFLDDPCESRSVRKATYRRNAAILNFTRTEKVLHDGLELLIRRETGSKIIFWGTVQLIVISGFCCDSIFHALLTADHEEGFFIDISTNVLKTPYPKD